MNKENMLLHLLFSFISYLLGSSVIVFFNIFLERLKYGSFKEKNNNNSKESQDSIGALFFYPFMISISSLILSIKYLKKNTSLF